MISETIQALVHEGQLSVQTLQSLLGWGRSSVHRRLSGEVSFSAEELLILCRNCAPGVGVAVCEALTAGTGIDHTYMDGAADLDGDGDVDTADLLLSGAATAQAFADELRQSTESAADGRLDHAEAESVLELCAEVRQTVHTTERIVNLIRRPPRKRARPVVYDPKHGPYVAGGNGRVQ